MSLNNSLNSDVAAGVDGVTWEMYADGLEGRLADLHSRLHRGAYRASPVRRVEIPKPDGGTRPLGIASLEDKIVQKAVTDTILVPIYETEFLGFSYGFRPGRGAHNALDALTVGIERRKVSWIVDADIRGFFDNVDRGWLIRFLEHRIGDKRVIRLIAKWLNAGVMKGTDWLDTGRGTPQGAIVSPVLANIYLHYVLDLWVHKTWRKRNAKGDMIIIRYADDFVVGFQHQWEAQGFLNDLRERLARFGLALHPDKTRLIEFGRFAKANRKKRGQGKPETFDFMGMTHFCDKTRKGKFRVGRKPVRKRVRRTLRRIKEELRKRWHIGKHEVARWLGRVINGWLNYYAVPGTSRALRAFVFVVKRMLLRALRRRSQKDHTEWRRNRSACPYPLAQGHYPPPVAGPATGRQYPRQEPDALTRTSGSVRGVPGNRHSYRDTATLKLTLEQAEFLSDVLPMALSVLRARQERRAWEASLYDPFANLYEDEPSQTGTSQPPSEAMTHSTSQKASAAVDGCATDDVPATELPIPARRGAPWTTEEEARLAGGYREGQGVAALADHFDRSPKAIQKRREKLGLVEAQAA